MFEKHGLKKLRGRSHAASLAPAAVSSYRTILNTGYRTILNTGVGSFMMVAVSDKSYGDPAKSCAMVC